MFDQLDRSFEGWRSNTKNQERKEHPTHNHTKEGYWIGHILHRNCVVKHVTEGRMEGKRRLWRKSKHLLDDLKKEREYWKLKEETLDRILWRSRFVTGYGPEVRRTTHCNEFVQLAKKFVAFEATRKIKNLPEPAVSSHNLIYTPVLLVSFQQCEGRNRKKIRSTRHISKAYEQQCQLQR